MKQKLHPQEPVQVLKDFVAILDPDTLDPDFALQLMKVFSEGEKVCAAGKALAAERVASSGAWKKEGDRSAAHFVSRNTGDSVGASVTLIETARRMSDLPKAEHAFRSGELTVAQAAEVASAASVSPKAEERLLRTARCEGISGLRQEARKVVQEACADEQEKAERLHRERYLRTWTDIEGAFRLDARLAPEAGAEVRAALDSLREDLFHQARRNGQKESFQALDADALVEMARASKNGEGSLRAPRAQVNVRVDYSALMRGHARPGEVCEANGVGPVPVSAARALLSDCELRVVFHKANKIESIAHLGRTIPAKLRTALVEIYPECVVEGCHETKRLEFDHVIPIAEGGPTSIGNVLRICKHHHALKTYRGFRLERQGTKGHKAKLLPPASALARASPSG